MYYNDFELVGSIFYDGVWRVSCDLVSTRWVEEAQERRCFRQMNGPTLNFLSSLMKPNRISKQSIIDSQQFS
jgi:hypothetical protein